MNEITIVSGLPRSGTSLMMRMLDLGGVEVLTDRVRQPDDDNPNGYYELEAVKTLWEGHDWLYEATGKAVKIVSNYLMALPEKLSYAVIFMRRDVEEILTSQRAMIERNGGSVDDDEEDRIRWFYNKHLGELTNWLSEQSYMRVTYVNHRHLINQPDSVLPDVARFLGRDVDIDKMTRAVDQRLYRHKS